MLGIGLADNERRENSVLTEKRESIGAFATRQMVLDVFLKPIQAGWAEIGEQYNDPYDWEYIPEFLDKAAEILDGAENWHLSEDQGIEIAKAVLDDKYCEASPGMGM